MDNIRADLYLVNKGGSIGFVVAKSAAQASNFFPTTSRQCAEVLGSVVVNRDENGVLKCTPCDSACAQSQVKKYLSFLESSDIAFHRDIFLEEENTNV